MTKSSNGQPIDFEPVYSKPNNRHTILFNYDSIVDFSIGIQENAKPCITQSLSRESTSTDEVLKAEIEGLFKWVEVIKIHMRNEFKRLSFVSVYFKVSVSGEYEFQIVRKDTQEPIQIQVMPKKNNSYRIKFEPLSITSYTLKAFQKTTPSISSNSSKFSYEQQHKI